MEKSIDFIKDRLKNLLIDEGYRYDIVNSVINSDDTNIFRITQRIEAVSRFVEDNDEALSYFTRINNLAKEPTLIEVNPELLENDLEKSFYETITSLKEKPLQNSEDYKEELGLIAETQNIGNDYLDNTMINVEDEAVKNNRLAMLSILANRIGKVFDISEIVR